MIVMVAVMAVVVVVMVVIMAVTCVMKITECSGKEQRVGKNMGVLTAVCV
jgi:hypothetical protein